MKIPKLLLCVFTILISTLCQAQPSYQGAVEQTPQQDMEYLMKRISVLEGKARLQTMSWDYDQSKLPEKMKAVLLEGDRELLSVNLYNGTEWSLKGKLYLICDSSKMSEGCDGKPVRMTGVDLSSSCAATGMNILRIKSWDYRGLESGTLAVLKSEDGKVYTLKLVPDEPAETVE